MQFTHEHLEIQKTLKRFIASECRGYDVRRKASERSQDRDGCRTSLGDAWRTHRAPATSSVSACRR